jgi:hypothetical protein
MSRALVGQDAQKFQNVPFVLPEDFYFDVISKEKWQSPSISEVRRE